MTARRRTRERRQPDEDPGGGVRLPAAQPRVEKRDADHPLLRAQAQLGNEATRRLVEASGGGGALNIQRQLTEDEVIELPPMEITAEAPDVGIVDDEIDLAGAWTVVLETLDLAGRTFGRGGMDNVMLAYELAASAQLLVLDLWDQITSERPGATAGLSTFNEWLDALLSALSAHAMAAAVPPETVQELLETVWDEGAAMALALQGLEDLEGGAEHA